MSIDVKKPIDCFKYPGSCAGNYHGDLTNDVIDALLTIDDVEEVKVNNDELFALLPGGDDFDDVIDTLTDATEMNKPEMVEAIKECIDMLKSKADEYNSKIEAASVDYLSGSVD